jgi:hypothetical protein
MVTVFRFRACTSTLDALAAAQAEKARLLSV